jgi:hypothetical protein
VQGAVASRPAAAASVLGAWTWPAALRALLLADVAVGWALQAVAKQRACLGNGAAAAAAVAALWGVVQAASLLQMVLPHHEGRARGCHPLLLLQLFVGP